MERGKSLFRIAICDDNLRVCSDVENSILKFSSIEQIVFSVEIYYNGASLRDDLKNGKVYDLIFLDIELESISGVEIGHFIREHLLDDNVQIVYISSYTKYALELFKVRPMDFLIKPITEEMVLKALSTGVKLLEKGEVCFQYKQGRDLNKIYIKDIIYFKSKDREVEIFTRNDVITFYGSLESIYEKLSDYNFFIRTNHF